MSLTCLKWPSETVHRAIIEIDRVVPACRTATKKAYKRLPGHMTVTCKVCLKIIKNTSK